MDLCREYGTYLGDICDVKPAICVIIFRRINQYICKPDWFICVSVWTGIILLRNMDLSGGIIGISVCRQRRRGRENLLEMTTSTFAIAENSSGRRYLYQAVDEMDKNHRVANTEETVGEARMYSTSGPMCPIATWLKYLSKLQPDYSCLW